MPWNGDIVAESSGTSQDLAGKVAIVTGAAEGIGRAVALALAGAGAAVAAVDVDVENLAGTKDLLGDGHRTEVLDVTDTAALTAFIDDVAATAGRLDILVNNAAVIVARTVVDCSEDEYDRVMAVNVKAPFFAIRAALPHLLDGGGSIVNLGSISALVGLPEQSVYCASKGALLQLTRQVAVDYAQKGVRCNIVCPGTIETPLLERFVKMASDADAARQGLFDKHPIGRFGTADEVAGVVRFLCTDAASYIHGAAISVDGGYVAW